MKALFTLALFVPFGTERLFAGPVEKGDEEFRAGHYAAALEQYSRALQRVPSDPSLNYRMGLSLYQMGRWEEASRYFQKSARSGEEPIEAERPSHLDDGLRWFRAGQYHLALLEFGQQVLDDPRSAEAHFNLAATCYKLDRYPEAEREIRSCLALDPSHVGARYLRGVLYERAGDRTRALSLFSGLASISSNDPYARRALDRYRMGGPESASSDFYGSLRTLTGFTQQWGASSVLATPDNSNGELNTQVGWSSRGDGIGANAFLSTGLSLRQIGNTQNWDLWKQVGASCNPTFLPGWAALAGYDFQQEVLAAQEQYRHHQVTLGLQTNRLGLDLLQIQGQWLGESYPTSGAMDSTGWIASLSARQSLSADLSLQGSGFLRSNGARDRTYDMDSRGLGVAFQRRGPATWELDLGAGVQWADYPNYPTASTVRRSDRSGGLYAEFRQPLLDKLYWLAGDSWWLQSSSLGPGDQESNRLYSGFQVFL